MLAAVNGRQTVLFGPRAKGLKGLNYRGFDVDTFLPAGTNVSQFEHRPTTWQIFSFRFKRMVLSLILFIIEWYFGVPPSVRLVLNRVVFWIFDALHKWRHPDSQRAMHTRRSPVVSPRAAVQSAPAINSPKEPHLGTHVLDPGSLPVSPPIIDSPQLPLTPLKDEVAAPVPNLRQMIRSQFVQSDSPNVVSVVSTFMTRARAAFTQRVASVQSWFASSSSTTPSALTRFRARVSLMFSSFVNVAGSLGHKIIHPEQLTLQGVFYGLVYWTYSSVAFYGSQRPTNISTVISATAGLSKTPRHIATAVSLDIAKLGIHMPKKPGPVLLASGKIVEPTPQEIAKYKEAKHQFNKQLVHIEASAIRPLIESTADLILATALVRGIRQLTIFERTGVLVGYMEELKACIKQRALEIYDVLVWNSITVASWSQDTLVAHDHFVLSPSLPNSSNPASAPVSPVLSPSSKKTTTLHVTLVDGSKTDLQMAINKVVLKGVSGNLVKVDPPPDIAGPSHDTSLTNPTLNDRVMAASREIRKQLIGSVSRPKLFVFPPGNQLSTLGFPSVCLSRTLVCTTVPDVPSPTNIEMLVHSLQQYANF